MIKEIKEKEVDEVLLPLFPTDDFSKLLFANKRIEELGKENTILFSKNLELQNELVELKDSTAITRKYKNIKTENKQLREKLKRFKKTNNDLIHKLNTQT